MSLSSRGLDETQMEMRVTAAPPRAAGSEAVQGVEHEPEWGSHLTGSAPGDSVKLSGSGLHASLLSEL